MTTDFEEWLEDADIEYEEEVDDLTDAVRAGGSSMAFEADRDGEILRVRRHGYKLWLTLVSEKARQAFLAHLQKQDVIDPDDPGEGFRRAMENPHT